MPATTTTIPRGTSKAKSNGTVPAKGWAPELHEIPVASIDVGANVRTDVGELAGLVDSIKAVGILEPIRVAEVGAGKYELVYGQRRLAAAKAAGLATIPAVVDAGAEVGQLRAIRQLIENLQREDLNALEEAKAYRAILDADQAITQAELARRLGRAAPTISNALRLLKLPAAVQKRIADGSLSASHAKAIASLPDAEAVKVAERVSKGKVSAHDVEQEIAAAKARQAEADRARDAIKEVLPKVEEQLAAAGATKEAASLSVVNEDLGEQLLAAGWAIVERPKGAEYLWNGQKCDCTVYHVNWYPHWGTTYKPDVSRLCVDAEHKRARLERQAKQRKADERKWEREREQRAAEEREARKAERGDLHGYASILLGDPARLDRIDLFTAFAGARWSTVVEWFVADSFQVDDPSVVEAGPLWEKVAELSDHEVATWRARLLAENIADWREDDQLRQLFLSHADEPKAAEA